MAASPLLQPGAEATFVPAARARRGKLAVWHPARPAGKGPRTTGGGDSSLILAIGRGDALRRRAVPVRWVELAQALPVLLDLPPDAPCGRSVHTWAQAARDALALVLAGQVLPGVDPDGSDSWRTGPLTPTDEAARFLLAATMPPAAHATIASMGPPIQTTSARWLVDRFSDAVADSAIRAAATALAARAEAGEETTAVADDPLDAAAEWLATEGDVLSDDIAVALRLEGDGLDGSLGQVLDATGFRATVQVTSRRDPSQVRDLAEVWESEDPDVASAFPQLETATLLTLRRGARAFPALRRLLEADRPDVLELDGEEAAELLGDTAEVLAARGIEVLWPAEVLRTVEITPTIGTTTVDPDAPSRLDLAGVCELRWQGAIDGVELTDDELARLIVSRATVVRLRGAWVRADPARLARLRQSRRIGGGAALAAALGAPVRVDGEEVVARADGALAGLADRLRHLDDLPPWQPAPGLAATLRPYQRTGVAWLTEMAELGLGGVLADDMGLGKTVQLLALHLQRTSRRRPTLVVCPVSVLGTWVREAERFAPGVPVRRYHGGSRHLDDLAPDGIVLTTYGVVRREPDVLAEVQWGIVAADEAQAVKNPVSRTARALRRIPAEARFALTGTPVENRLVDLWALLDWTTPGLLGTLDRFRREVAGPIERDRDPEATERLTRVVRPFLMRRRKLDPDIAPELPPKTETDRIVPLTAEQAALYRALVQTTLGDVAGASGMARRGLVLRLLTGLKQICDHPAHFLGQDGPLTGRSGKLDAVTELLDTVVAEGDAALVFTQYVVMGRLLERHLTEAGMRVALLHGGVPVGGRQRMVDDFQAGELDVLVASVKAGGVGLNLTRATHVVHYDRWWNPAVEDQASDRAWRIGQDRPVQVHRMICEGTVEDRIAALLEAKRDLADVVVTAGEGWISELDDDALADLVSLADLTDLTDPTPDPTPFPTPF